MKLTGKTRRTRAKTCPSATLSTTKPTWIEPGSNSGLRGETPATKRLSHGTANITICKSAHVMIRQESLHRHVTQATGSA
jgi:hypothetical protein